MGNGQRVDLLDNISAAVNGSAFRWLGGAGSFIVEATAYGGGATVSLEFQTPNGTWIAVSSSTTAIGADAKEEFTLPKGQIRAVSTGTPTSIFAYAVRE